MNRLLTPDESLDARGLVLRCVAEAECDRLLAKIVDLERKLQRERDFRGDVIDRCQSMMLAIEKTIDAPAKFCDTHQKP